MKTEGMLIYHKITVAMGLLQNNAFGNELVLFCLIIPCAVCLCSIFAKSVSGYSGFVSVDAIVRTINQSDCNRSMYTLECKVRS